MNTEDDAPIDRRRKAVIKQDIELPYCLLDYIVQLIRHYGTVSNPTHPIMREIMPITAITDAIT